MTSDAVDKRVAQLEARVRELARERDTLAATVDILQSIGATRGFEEIVQTIARKLGEGFALDRSSIFLAGDGSEVRLVASYEDPTVRNLVVDVGRYPELRRVFASGETVFVPDAIRDPMFAPVRDELERRNVRAIIVVPIRWRQEVIGAILLRTARGARPFGESEVRFCETVADLTAKALRSAQRFEAMLRSSGEKAADEHHEELRAVALLAFLRRLLGRHGSDPGHLSAEARLATSSGEELERLVGVALRVIDEEARG
jgi:two-component system sensor histidine kinase ChiS